MRRLLFSHAIKHAGGGGKVFAKRLDKIGVNAFIFFFQSDCQSEYFLFSKAFKAAHSCSRDVSYSKIVTSWHFTVFKAQPRGSRQNVMRSATVQQVLKGNG